ncbi:MAG: mechanosensitive ion channel family protein [Deltaproteobacteria bacterium]|nr:mechanosensitive ion channel family protein [Deltaproteobacteria bacterium]
MPEWIDRDLAWAGIRAALVLLAGIPLAKLLARLAGRAAARRFSPQSVMVTRKLVFYAAVLILVMMALHELGFHLATLLGAAGIVGVALGFASQTSMSNVVSGLFLLSERAFQVGDVIEVGGITGEVLSVDLLSAKVRTFDNRVVRIPNETLIRSEVINATHYPVRRLDLAIGVAFAEDVDRVEAVLREVAERNPLCLDEPAPVFVFRGFGESSLECQFSVWFLKEDVLAVRSTLLRDIHRRFRAEGIEIPYPHRALVPGPREPATPPPASPPPGAGP